MTIKIGIRGGCLCGIVRYESLSQPVRAVMCHCSTCKKHSGAPAVAFAIFAIEQFTWLGSLPVWYPSSLYADRGFCLTCGSSIAMRGHDDPGFVEIYAGTLDEPDALTVQDHVWTSEQASWLRIDDGLPRYRRARE